MGGRPLGIGTSWALSHRCDHEHLTPMGQKRGDGEQPKALRKACIPLLVLGFVSNLSVRSREGPPHRAGRESYDVRAHLGMWPGRVFWCDVLLDFI